LHIVFRRNNNIETAEAELRNALAISNNSELKTSFKDIQDQTDWLQRKNKKNYSKKKTYSEGGNR
jgi:hypothetical protein